MSLGSLLKAGAVLSISEDVIILLLPIAEVRKLNMDWRKKVMVLFLFSIGIMSVFLFHLHLFRTWRWWLTLLFLIVPALLA